MTYLGWFILIVAAIVYAAALQILIQRDVPYRWILTAIATLAGAVVTSEFIYQGATPEIEGFGFWPALIGGALVGLVVDLVAQRAAPTSGTPG